MRIFGGERSRGIDRRLAPKGSHELRLSGASPIVRDRGRLAKIATTDNALIVLAIALLSLAVTSNSLWIDEAFTAWVVAHGSLPGVYAALRSSMLPTSDQQYPLYNLWIFAWSSVFGSSEYALRASNIPFGAIFVGALALSSRLIFNRRFAWIVFVATPFSWFYMNEARSYMMLLAFSTAAVSALGIAIYGTEKHRKRALWMFVGSLFIAFATNVLAILMVPGIIIIALMGLKKGTINLKVAAPALLAGAPLFVTLLGYYGYTFLEARPVAVADNHRSGPAIAYALAGLYEQVGLSGIGPPRNVLRSANIAEAIRSHAWLLGTALLAYAIAVLASLRRKPDSPTLGFFVSWITCLIFGAVLSHFLGARFLGRHFSATLPFLLIGSIGLFRSWLSLGLIALVFGISDYRLSDNPEYAKDDYRSAVSAVIDRVKGTGGAVDWAADGLAANYYGLHLRYSPGLADYNVVHWPVRASGISVADWPMTQAKDLVSRQLKAGDVYIAISKPDLFDDLSTWGRIVKRPTAKLVGQFQGFEIYELGRQ